MHKDEAEAAHEKVVYRNEFNCDVDVLRDETFIAMTPEVAKILNLEK